MKRRESGHTDPIQNRKGCVSMSALLLENSKTKENLMRAFAGESQARNRYTFAAGLAKRKGLEVIQGAFLFTADQEKAHAKVFYDLLTPMSGENILVDGRYPLDLYSDMAQHLRAAEHNENQEHDEDYAEFSKIAKEEGFAEISHIFTMIAGVEKTHAQRFGTLAQLLEEEKLFVSQVETGWMCLNCGQIVHSTMAPALCPICKHGQGFFVRLEMAPYTKIQH